MHVGRLFFLLLSFLYCPGQVSAQPAGAERFSGLERFESRRHGVGFRYDPAFELLQSPAAHTVALLKHRVEGYPTFNVLLQGGPFNAAQFTAASFTKLVLDDYAKVGILNPKVVRTVRSAIGAGIDSWTSELEYPIAGNLVITGVSLVGAGDHHYVLTYIDIAAMYYQRKRLREDIIESFTLTAIDPQVLSEAGSPPPAPDDFPAYFVIALLVSFAALAVLVWRRRR